MIEIISILLAFFTEPTKTLEYEFCAKQHKMLNLQERIEKRLGCSTIDGYEVYNIRQLQKIVKKSNERQEKR